MSRFESWRRELDKAERTTNNTCPICETFMAGLIPTVAFGGVRYHEDCLRRERPDVVINLEN